MLRLAVATEAETYERMQEPLAERGIEVAPIQTSNRTFAVSETGQCHFPDGDFDVGFVFPSRLAEGGVSEALLGINWVNGREELLRSRFKGETLARLAGENIPVPSSITVSNPTDTQSLIEAFEQFDPPVVVKPNSTTQGIGVAKAHDLDSFLGICDYLDLVHDYRATGDQSFLIQEYIPEARDYRAMVIDGEYAGAVQRKLPATALADGRWKHNVHRGAVAEGVSLDPELRTLVENVATTLDIPWLGVDLLVRDDRVVVNETNARPTIDSATKYEDGFWDAVASLITSRVRE